MSGICDSCGQIVPYGGGLVDSVPSDTSVLARNDGAGESINDFDENLLAAIKEVLRQVLDERDRKIAAAAYEMARARGPL